MTRCWTLCSLMMRTIPSFLSIALGGDRWGGIVKPPSARPVLRSCLRRGTKGWKGWKGGKRTTPLFHCSVTKSLVVVGRLRHYLWLRLLCQDAQSDHHQIKSRMKQDAMDKAVMGADKSEKKSADQLGQDE